MNKLHFILFIAITTSLVSCQKQSQKESSSKEEIFLQQGAEISDALMKSLGAKLKASLKAGGPEQAITVCQAAAIPSTLEVSNRFQDASISRITLKPRNPSNAAQGHDEEVLKKWQKELEKSGEKPSDIVVRHGDSSVFYRPIMIKRVCLKCHGAPETFSEGLRVKLANLYPSDRAVGYSLGDLRGAFRVEFKSEKK